MNSRRLGRRFFALTSMGYFVALISCVVVVWSVSVPFVKAAKREYLQDLANQNANTASFMLDDVYDRAEHMARLPSILDLVLGMNDDTALVSDRIIYFKSRNLVHAKILDYNGDTLHSINLKTGNERLFADVEFREGFRDLPRVTIGSSRAGRIRLRTDTASGSTNVLIGVPILARGVMEGAAVLEFGLGPNAGLPGGSNLITSFQQRLSSEAAQSASASLPGLPLFVRMSEDAGQLQSDVSQTTLLTARITLGLSFVLLVPFFAMSYFGAKHLVAPTHALERSRAHMARQKEKLKRQSEELRELAAVAELSKDAITVTDPDAKILWVNNAFTEMTGYEHEEVVGRKPGQVLQGPDSDPATILRIRQALSAGEPVREEILNVSKTGDHIWIALSISPITDENGELKRFAAISSDITDRRRVQEELALAQRETEYRATHDTLTGLPNRRRLDRVLDTEVTTDAVPRTLIRVDLDFFKNVNDTMGHAAGDHVLKVVSNALRDFSRKDDLVARVGGDEFVVLLAPGSTMEEASALCERFRSEIRKDIFFEGKTCRVGASFGVASAADNLIGNQELLIGADAALYISKSKGRNTTTLYTPQVHTDVLNKRRSAMEIEKAIENEEFEPYFQPQIGAKKREFVGLEALVRWKHAEQGVLSPDAFLSLADQLSLIPEIDEIIYRKGLQAVQDLKKQGYEMPKVSFNVGVKQLENPHLRNLHKHFDLEGTQIAFEVLESVLVEEQEAAFAFQIDMLRDLGFRIEVDDFGSGHASIVGLLHLRPDAMKLDQRLVNPLTVDPNAAVTVRSLIEIGQAQGISVTAEGVETEEQAQILTDLGVDTLQGYRFSKPIAAREIAPFLDALNGKARGVA